MGQLPTKVKNAQLPTTREHEQRERIGFFGIDMLQNAATAKAAQSLQTAILVIEGRFSVASGIGAFQVGANRASLHRNPALPSRDSKIYHFRTNEVGWGMVSLISLNLTWPTSRTKVALRRQHARGKFQAFRCTTLLSFACRLRFIPDALTTTSRHSGCLLLLHLPLYLLPHLMFFRYRFFVVSFDPDLSNVHLGHLGEGGCP